MNKFYYCRKCKKEIKENKMILNYMDYMNGIKAYSPCCNVSPGFITCSPENIKKAKQTKIIYGSAEQRKLEKKQLKSKDQLSLF